MSASPTTETRVISFHYTLTNVAGEVIDTSRDTAAPFSYLEGQSQIIPGLEKAMAALKTGDKKKIEIEAQDAYGNHDAQLVVEIEKEKLPKSEDLREGDQFQASGPNGEALMFRVVGFNGEQVQLDGNHPLAGEKLVFDVEVVDVRNATADEVEHGHVHGPGGHHH